MINIKMCSAYRPRSVSPWTTACSDLCCVIGVQIFVPTKTMMQDDMMIMLDLSERMI